MYDNQHRNVTISWQDEGELYLISQVCTSERSIKMENFVRVYKLVKLAQHAECFYASLSLLSKDCTVGVIIFLLHLRVFILSIKALLCAA